MTVIYGTAVFSGDHELEVTNDEGTRKLTFDQAIVAVGSRVVRLSGFPWDDPRVMDSTAALTLPDVPPRLLVVGGGIIGLEMATVYGAIGSQVTVAELSD